MSEWTRTEKLGLYALLVAIMGVCVAMLTVPEFRQIFGLNTSTTNSPESSNVSSTQLKGVKTIPKGEILGDEKNGLHYKNLDNSLQIGVAYKYTYNNSVYTYDGKLLHPFSSEGAYYKFYGCSSNIRIIDCAPVYEIPSFVTSKMLEGSPIL